MNERFSKNKDPQGVTYKVSYDATVQTVKTETKGDSEDSENEVENVEEAHVVPPSPAKRKEDTKETIPSTTVKDGKSNSEDNSAEYNPKKKKKIENPCTKTAKGKDKISAKSFSSFTYS